MNTELESLTLNKEITTSSILDNNNFNKILNNNFNNNNILNNNNSFQYMDEIENEVKQLERTIRDSFLLLIEVETYFKEIESSTILDKKHLQELTKLNQNTNNENSTQYNEKLSCKSFRIKFLNENYYLNMKIANDLYKFNNLWQKNNSLYWYNKQFLLLLKDRKDRIPSKQILLRYLDKLNSKTRSNKNVQNYYSIIVFDKKQDISLNDLNLKIEPIDDENSLVQKTKSNPMVIRRINSNRVKIY